MAARLQQLRRGAAREAGADRVAVAERLGDGGDVRRHAGALAGEHGAGAAHAGLHLVQHQQRAALVAQRAQPGQVGVVRRAYAALALDRLDQHGGDVRMRVEGAAHGREVVEGNLREALGVGCEAVAHPRPGGGAQGEQGAAVEGAVGHQHPRRFKAAAVAVQARELQRALVGLGAGIGEERPLHAGRRGQPRRQFLLQRDAVQVGGVHQLAGLLAHGGRHRRVAVAQAAHGDAGDRVQVGVARLVPQPAAGAAREARGQPGVGRQQGGAGVGHRFKCKAAARSCRLAGSGARVRLRTPGRRARTTPWTSASGSTAGCWCGRRASPCSWPWPSPRRWPRPCRAPSSGSARSAPTR